MSGGSMSRGMSGQSLSRGGGNPSAASRSNFVSRNFGSKSQVSGFRGVNTGRGLGNISRGNNFVGRNFAKSGNLAKGNFNNFNRFGFEHRGFHHFFPFGFGFFPWWGWGYGWPWWWWNGYDDWGGYGDYGYVSYAPAEDVPPPTADQQQAASDYIAAGEQAFGAARYQEAIRDWQHALVDDPNNGGVVLLIAQALFAVGKYQDAAGAVQMAMQMLPENEWGVVAKNYTQLYPNIQLYTDQLKALEKARDEKPDDPALRFLLGYHFGYLGYPKQAARELDKALDLQPKDLGSQKLRDLFAPQAGLPAREHPPQDEVPGAPSRDVKPSSDAQSAAGGVLQAWT